MRWALAALLLASCGGQIPRPNDHAALVMADQYDVTIDYKGAVMIHNRTKVSQTWHIHWHSHAEDVELAGQETWNGEGDLPASVRLWGSPIAWREAK